MGKEKKTTYDTVKEVMEEDPRCRIDDKWLIIQVLRKMGFHFYIDYRDLKDIPAFETITKCRRKIQHTENILNEHEIFEEEGITYEPQIKKEQ